MKRKLEYCVISDSHLGTSGSAAKELNSYLKGIDPETLILNGDIIDGWRFSRNRWKKHHNKVVRRILKMAESGTKVYLLPGNHDEALRRFTPMKFGNISLEHKLVQQIGSQRVVFFHGDVFDLVMIHSKWLGKIGSWAYDTLIWANTRINNIRSLFGMKRISFSAKIKNSVKSAVTFISDFERVCAEYAKAEGYDAVACGHIHQPCIRKIDGITYMNSGDWVESLTSLEYDGEWTIYRYHDTEDGSEDDDIDDYSYDLQKLMLG